MPRVCVDTNVWLSGLYSPSGPPGRVVSLALAKRFRLIISAVILAEIEKNLIAKFEVRPKDARNIRRRILQVAEVHEPRGTLQVIAENHDDNLILETAVLGKARYLVTGDHEHLLLLGMFKMTKIIAPAAFLPIVEGTKAK